MAFHQPRLEGVRNIVARATVDGTAYTRITLDPRGRFDVHFRTFALDGAGAAVRRINARLVRAWPAIPRTGSSAFRIRSARAHMRGASTRASSRR
jgi:hypothetical protein